MAVSLLVHVLLAGYRGGSGDVPSAAIVPAPLQARLELISEALSLPAAADIPPTTAPVATPLATPVTTHHTTLPPPVISPRRLPVPVHLAAVEPSPAGVAASGPDLRFYLARELDRYPAPLTALSLDDGRGTAGGVRLWVSIDQTGRVLDVAVIDADPPGEFERLARERVLATRFVPAARDGRQVKSRILLVMRGGS